MTRSLPKLKQLVADFHTRGVKVLLPYNPWDTGTNRTGGACTMGGSYPYCESDVEQLVHKDPCCAFLK